MRYLGIDYGGKRMGVALSDPGGRLAFPEAVIFHNGIQGVWEKIKVILQKERISKIVIGLPMGLDGKETEESREVRQFTKELKRLTALPIEFENEIFTTRMAKTPGVKKDRLDASAAAIILQSYLDKISRI